MSAIRSWLGSTERLEKSFLVAVFCVFATTASFGEEPTKVAPTKVPALKAPPSRDWKIEIIPGPAIGPSPVPKAKLAASQTEAKSAAIEPASVVVNADADTVLPGGITPAAYAEVYNSIPFRRSEYVANPNYRHEATIELLLGQIRPKTVAKVSAPAATCCSPRAVSYVGFFNPWAAKNFYYHYSYSRPSSYWVW